MKLGELRAVIRKSKATPTVHVSVDGSPIMCLALQKMALLESLETAFPGGKATETDLVYDEVTGLLRGDGGAVAQPPVRSEIVITETAAPPTILDI